MYKQRKNFFSSYTPAAELKKIEAKKILSSMFEGLDTATLTSLYQNEEEPKENKFNPPSVPQIDPSSVEIKFEDPNNRTATQQELQKVYDSTVVSGKPFKITFSDIAPAKPIENTIDDPLREETEMLEDEVLVPMEYAPEETKEHEEKEKSEEDKEKEEPEEDEEKEYDFMSELPKLDLSADMLDAINKAGQGMMGTVMINPTINVLKDGPHSPVVPIHNGSKIKSIEDDLEGLSVAGLDNDIAFKLF